MHPDVQNSHDPKSGAIRCYAIRRVNPFLGVWQVIKTPAARAISSDGTEWDIDIRAEQRNGWGSLNRNTKSHAYFCYGLWSKERGLRCRPVPPGVDSQTVRMSCDDLVKLIEDVGNNVPFPLVDDKELWLLDLHEQRPLALLASLDQSESSGVSEPRSWSASMSGYGLAGLKRFHAARELQHIVKKRAGFNMRKQWITRHADGSGTAHDPDATVMAAEEFPPYLLRQDWEDNAHTSLVEEYLTWIAPALLTLQRITTDQRLYLEQRLQVSAVSVDHHWKLYPATIDIDLVNAARVQGHIQSSTVEQEQ